VIYLADWLQDIRRKLRDTAPHIDSTQNITDASTIFNVTAASVGFAKVGQVIELVALSAGVPTGTLEQCLITAVTPGVIPRITVIRAYGTDQIGSTATFRITFFDFWTNAELIDRYNDVVKGIFPDVFQTNFLCFVYPSNLLLPDYQFAYVDGVLSLVANFPEDVSIYAIEKWTTPFHKEDILDWLEESNFALPAGATIWSGGVPLRVEDASDVQTQYDMITDYQSPNAKKLTMRCDMNTGGFIKTLFISPFPQVAYDKYIYVKDEHSPRIPSHIKNLINLGVEIGCYESMMPDRLRYDKFSTQAMNRSGEYAFSNHLALLRNEFNQELARKAMAKPPIVRSFGESKWL